MHHVDDDITERQAVAVLDRMCRERNFRPGMQDVFSARLAVIGLLSALSRVGEHSSAEIARVSTTYFRARDELEPVSREELLDRLRSGTVTLLDVRPENEFAYGHLPGALNVPLAQLARRFAELPPDHEVIAYCRGPWCVLSFEAVALLRRCGYRARRLEDGFPEWKTAGLPISHGL
ncbi:MAG: rhodanese-like domain-containing protein [Stellaceae bacterium]